MTTKPPDALDCRAVQASLADELKTPAGPVERHVAECPACRAFAERRDRAWTLLGALEDREPSPRFAAGVMAKLASAETRRRPLSAPWLRWTAVASAFAALVLVASIILDRVGADDDAASGVVAELDLDVLESQEMLQHLDVIEDLDLLLLLDEG